MDSSFEKKDVESQAGTEVEPVLLPMDAHQQHTNTSFKRGLKSRHIQLLSIGGVIGTGLFIGSGRAITNSGPLSALLSYSIFCAIIFQVNQGAGEMATLLPVHGAFVHWANRFVEPAAGFACGWNYYYTTLAFGGADIVAVVGLCHYWLPETNAAIWVTASLLIFGLLNFTPVRVYGATEFYFSISKVVLIIGLILMTFVLMVGGNPNHDAFGFRYWKNPGVMKEYVVDGATGRFLGFWYCFKIAAFSIGGPEFVSMAASEAINPRQSIPKAIRRVFYRLAFFYVLGILSVGILVPFNDMILIEAIKTETGVGASPFVRGMVRAGLNNVLPNIMNAIVLLSALSCGNSFCYVSIRSLNGLAKDGRAPKIFARTTKHGVPYVAAGLTIGILCLSYMTVSNTTAAVFTWFLDLASIGALANYTWMMITYTRFHKATKAQGLYDSLPFKGVFMPWGAYMALFFLILIMLTNGFEVFITGHWSTQTFITSYFAIPFNLALYLLGKFLYRKEPGIPKPEEADLVTGKQEIDEDEAYWLKQKEGQNLTKAQKFWDWLF